MAAAENARAHAQSVTLHNHVTFHHIGDEGRQQNKTKTKKRQKNERVEETPWATSLGM